MRRYIEPIANPGIYIGVLLAAVMVALAFQVRSSYDIGIGTATDGPMLSGFNTPEVLTDTTPISFRWSTGDAAITLRDIGRQDLKVVLSLSGYRPAGQPPAHLLIQTNGKTLLDVDPVPYFDDYPLAISREDVKDGTLRLDITTNEFIPPGDPNPRPLGVMLTRIRITPSTDSADRFTEPPVDMMLAAVGMTAVLGLFLAAVGWGVGGVTLGCALLGALITWLLVSNRFWLTSGGWYNDWLLSLIAGVVVALLAGTVGRWLLRAGGVVWGSTEGRVLLTAIAVVFAVRLAGQLNPGIFIPDAGFHQHRFEIVESGQLLFTVNSSEWGKAATFYLPTVYIFMLPLHWLVADDLLMVKIFTVAISTLGVLPLFYIVKRLLRDGRAALIASVLYLCLPMAVLPFSWGITSNLFGEVVALCVLAVVAGSYRSLRPTHPSFYLLLALLLVLVLSHPGVLLLASLGFACICLLFLVSRQGGVQKRSVPWMLAAFALAAGFSYLIYYYNFVGSMLSTFGELSKERASQAASGAFRLRVGGSVADESLGLNATYVSSWGEWFWTGLRWFWQEAQAYYKVWPFAGALLGYVVVRREASSPYRTTRRREEKTRLLLIVTGWTLSFLAFAIVGWVMNLYVRYMLFALPLVAIGVGVLLSRLWTRGRLGVALSMLLLVFFGVGALALWEYRISYAFK